VAASTQNQALGALLFMYQKVLGRELEFMENFDRAQRRQRIPVVLSREEVQRLLTAVPAKYRLFCQLLYGTGMRLMEGLRLRVRVNRFAPRGFRVNRFAAYKKNLRGFASRGFSRKALNYVLYLCYSI
jgi:integrase